MTSPPMHFCWQNAHFRVIISPMTTEEYSKVTAKINITLIVIKNEGKSSDKFNV